MDAPWTVSLTVPVAWGEMDAFGHVNNTVYLRWFESARIGYFERLGMATVAADQRSSWPILARTAIDYRSPVVYPDTIAVEARVSKLGNTSFTMLYRVRSQAQDRIVAEGEAVIVMIDPKSGAKVPLDAETRAKVQALEKL